MTQVNTDATRGESFRKKKIKHGFKNTGEHNAQYDGGKKRGNQFTHEQNGDAEQHKEKEKHRPPKYILLQDATNFFC